MSGPPLTRVQKDSLLREQEEDIARIVRTSNASSSPSPYDLIQPASELGFPTAAASHNENKTLVPVALVLANARHVNLANKHRLEQLAGRGQLLRGWTAGDKSGRRGVHAGAGAADWKSEAVLVQRDSSPVLTASASASASASAASASAEGVWTGSVEEKETAAAEDFALSSRGVGSILHTGSAVVSIPHSSHAVAINPRTRSLPNKQSAARAVSSAIALGEHAGSAVSRSPVSKPRGRDLSSRKYSDKHSGSEAPLLRYKDGDWKVEHQHEQEASREMLQSTSLASLSRSIAEIEEERQKLHPDTSFFL